VSLNFRHDEESLLKRRTSVRSRDEPAEGRCCLVKTVHKRMSVMDLHAAIRVSSSL